MKRSKRLFRIVESNHQWHNGLILLRQWFLIYLKQKGSPKKLPQNVGPEPTLKQHSVKNN